MPLFQPLSLDDITLTRRDDVTEAADERKSVDSNVDARTIELSAQIPHIHHFGLC